MAHFLVERAPDLEGLKTPMNDLSRKTKRERKALITRRKVLAHTVELAIARCLRPDLVQ